MKKWEYAHVTYSRNHTHGEVAIDPTNTMMSDIPKSAGLHVDTFLKAAGERGWELGGTLVPFAPGKQLTKEVEGGDDTYYVVKDALDIQWLIFKREKA